MSSPLPLTFHGVGGGGADGGGGGASATVVFRVTEKRGLRGRRIHSGRNARRHLHRRFDNGLQGLIGKGYADLLQLSSEDLPERLHPVTVLQRTSESLLHGVNVVLAAFDHANDGLLQLLELFLGHVNERKARGEPVLPESFHSIPYSSFEQDVAFRVRKVFRTQEVIDARRSILRLARDEADTQDEEHQGSHDAAGECGKMDAHGRRSAASKGRGSLFLDEARRPYQQRQVPPTGRFAQRTVLIRATKMTCPLRPVLWPQSVCQPRISKLPPPGIGRRRRRKTACDGSSNGLSGH